MLSSIGRAAIKRIGGLHPSANRFLASTWQLQRVEAHQNAAIISRSSSRSLLARRSYATATKSAPAKKPAAKKAATKKPAAKTTTTTKSAAKKPAKKDVKKPVKKAKAKAKPKAKVKAKPKPKPKRTKKPLSESVQTYREKKRLGVVALLAEEPKLKATTARTVHLQETLTGGKGKNDFVQVTAAYNALTPAEIEVCIQCSRHLFPITPQTEQFIQRLNHTANENKAANEVALKKWVATHTPDEIRIANNARLALRKLKGKQVPRPIPDDRQPRRPVHALLFFIKDRYASGDFSNLKARDSMGLIAKEWKALAPAQRKVSFFNLIYFPFFHSNGNLQTYEDQAAADKLRYWREVKTVFNREPSTSPPA
jgi:hypothetical protein